MVLADREIELPEGPFATVTSDNYRGGQLVARNLAENGARRVLVLGANNEAESSSLEARLAGFEAEVNNRGLETIYYRIHVDPREADQLMESLLGTVESIRFFALPT